MHPKLAEWHLYGLSGRIGIRYPEKDIYYNQGFQPTEIFARDIRWKSYSLTDHLGNIRSTFSDMKVISNGNFMVDLTSAASYYPFGMEIPGRTWNNGTGYRYGWGGHEKDNACAERSRSKIKGEGNTLATHFRLNDPRTGRWFTMDPVTHFSQSPYTSMDNNPVNMIDLWGAAAQKSSGSKSGSGSGSGGSKAGGGSGGGGNSGGGGSGGSKGGSSKSGGSGGGISPESIGKDPSSFQEGGRAYSGPFKTDWLFHNGLFYREQKYRSIVQDLVDSYGDGKAFHEKSIAFANENGLSENFNRIFSELGIKTYGGSEIIGENGLKNPFINFGLESNDFDLIAVASVIGLVKNGAKYVFASSVEDLSEDVGVYLFQNWHKGTFPNRAQSLVYHLSKHGKGRTAIEYTRDAMKFYKNNVHIGKNVILKDGTSGIKIQTKQIINGKTKRIGGFWTKDGKVVTFWD